jgi:hypothetical protein
MKELRVKVLLVMEHAPDRVEQPAHDGDERHLLLFAAGEQVLVGGFYLRAALDGDQGRHEQGQAQVAIAGAADVTRSILLPALAGPRVEAGVGDPLFGFQVGRQHEQFAEQAQGADFRPSAKASRAPRSPPPYRRGPLVQPRASAALCFTKSSPLHSWSLLTVLASAAAFCAALRSAWRFTRSACVVK